MRSVLRFFRQRATSGGFLFLSFASAIGAQDVTVAVDPRFELVSIVFRLTGNPDYGMGQVPAYDTAVANYFSQFRDHPAVARARDLSREHGLYFDRPAQLAPLFGPAPQFGLRVPINDPGVRVGPQWPREQIPPLIELMSQFARDSRFMEFLLAQRALFASAGKSLDAVLRRDIDASWYPKFFGIAAENDFRIVPAPLIGGANYGLSFTPEGQRGEVWAVIGVSSIDSSGAPQFSRTVSSVIVHEFNHSFVGPVADRWMPRMNSSAVVLTEAVKDQLVRWGYGQPSTTIHESLVRAAVITYMRERGDHDAAQEQLLDDERRGFIWESGLVALMGQFQVARERYPTFESFMPRVIDYFDGVRDSISQVILAYDARRPGIESIAPPPDTSVVSGEVELVLTFDRPMRDPRRVQRRPGVPADAFPRVVGTRWSADRRQLTIALRLEPGRSYDFMLTDAVSADGVALRPTALKMRTKP